LDFSFFASLPIWVKWFLLALGFFFIELLHAAWVLVWFGIAALGAALVAVFFPHALVIQIATFFVLTAVAVGVYFGVIKNDTPPPPPPPDGVGKEVPCVEKIDNHNFTGAIRYGSRDWNAKSYDDDVVIENGQRVIIIRWEVATAVVRPIPKRTGDDKSGAQAR
jgi:membrane protein implicated in regulation of membrane protease activity